jgi:hypothetical protein
LTSAPTILSSFYTRYFYFVISLPLCNKYSDYCDIYLYTLCYCICCLLGACMRCTRLGSLKPGVTFSQGRCSALGLSSSCPPTAATTWYSSPRSTTTTTVVGSPGGGELDDDFPPWRKKNTRVCPATLLAGGGGDGATVARQEAAPHRLSDQSESTTPAPLRGTCQVLSSHLRQRRVSLPSNVPTPSGLMTPAPSRRTCWALASYLR